jgi:hypothetical protein
MLCVTDSSLHIAKPPGLLTGASFLVASARYEVQERTSGRNLEVVRVRFRVRGGAMVPAGDRGDPRRAGRRARTVR